MWHRVIARLLLAALTIPLGVVETRTDRVLLPVEVLGADGTTEGRAFTLAAAQCESARSLWLQVHGLRYLGQASVQVNESSWIPLRNDTATVARPGSIFGGIGGGFATLVLTVPLPTGALAPGSNAIRFRFEHSDGLSSGYRVLGMNFLTSNGTKILSSDNFVDDTPENWTAPLSDAASIQSGADLWHNGSLVASSLRNSPRIQAKCADCHARDGRDLKYFNFSNHSIVTRAVFHGLTMQQGEQIASYIRNLNLPHPGRPWNPPYQPGLDLDEQPIENWAAGAGLDWVLDKDANALPYLVAQQRGTHVGHGDVHELARQITPALFHPDGDLNPRDIPILLQLPDWNQWLPRVHPKDAWGPAFTRSRFAAMYDAKAPADAKSGTVSKSSLRALLAAAQHSEIGLRAAVPAFTRWSQARHAFLAEFVNGKTVWSPNLSDKVYSTQLWQLVKTWEMTEEFGLEARGREVFGSHAESRTWLNAVPSETAPASTHIPNGNVGVGGSALTNEYLTASWYELQVILNSGNHEHQGRSPVNWIYLVHEFRDLYEQTHEAEPIRLLVAVTKAQQSTDPDLGPDDYSKGWRPEQNVGPRIMVAPEWAPIFKTLPQEVRSALVESLLAAWMDKSLQYPITKYLPLPVAPHDDTIRYAYRDISGRQMWLAAEEFRAAGVSSDVIERLQNWGHAYTDRAVRLQYH